jgi:beta-glucosidase
MTNAEPQPLDWGSLATDHPLSAEEINAKAQELLGQMTLQEKIAQMSGDMPLFRGVLDMLGGYNRRPYIAGQNQRLGLPGLRFSDGPRGVVMYHSTCFPVAIGRAAAWDPELEAEIGDVIGVEARAQGANFFGGVCINLLRHPAWGRAQESYGEDPYLMSEMGAALVRGVQRHIMACIKHYACNSIENARFKVDVRIDERTLQETYLPHFRRCVREGAAAVMSAYNKVNGHYCGHNRRLLREILKEEWGFEGFVISDFINGVRDAKAAVLAGLDIEMPFQFHYHRDLQKLVERGEVPETLIDEAALRILRQMIRFAQVGEPGRYDPAQVSSTRHRALARRAAAASIVLLKNGPGREGHPLLPLAAAGLKRLAVIGELADFENIGDHGSSRVRPPQVITPLQGIRAALEGTGCQVEYRSGRKFEAAVDAARQAERAIVFAGYRPHDEGEYMFAGQGGGDRASLRLPTREVELIQHIAQAQPNLVVVMIGGSAIICEEWRARVPGILIAWYPGMEGGHAIADILFGTAEPEGRLPCTIPVDESQLPFFDRNTDSIGYGYFHGYRLFDRKNQRPAYYFGYGLSYTTFALGKLTLSPSRLAKDGTLRVLIHVTNTGARPGAEVIQLYIGREASGVERPVKELKAFRKVRLLPGETKTVELHVPARELAGYDADQSRWVVEPGRYFAWVGPSAQEEGLLRCEFRIK